MHLARLSLTSMFLVLAVVLPVASTGCADHHYYRVYDPYYSDYHRWGPDEDAYYHRWEAEGHRDHREWKERSPEEQKEYWGWRHAQNHDHDHDHDRH